MTLREPQDGADMVATNGTAPADGGLPEETLQELRQITERGWG
jgi:hypothetical protein